MKFFHIADLHLGRSFFQLSMAEKDQPYWIDRLLELADREKPDAVVIAGDIYDRRDPSPEAMALFSRLITQLASRQITVLAIPGNHDHELRLSHMHELLENSRIFIAGPLQKELQHITLPTDPPVTFWLLPYTFPKYIAGSRVLNDPQLRSADDAFRALFAAQPIDSSACNVLVAHQNVLSSGAEPEHSASETLIGGLGGIDSSVFGSFDYVALGHIHNAQKAGRPAVRYAGCPLYYDFSELHRRKDITMVTVNSKDDIRIEALPVPLLHRLAQYEGSFDELAEKGKDAELSGTWLQCVVTDSTLPFGAADRLREVFGEALVNIKRKESLHAEQDPFALQGEGFAEKSLAEQFAVFMEEVQAQKPTAEQLALLEKAAQQQGADDLLYDAAERVPQEQSEALLNLLRSLAQKEADHETA